MFSRTKVFEWFKRCKQRREDRQDDQRSGRPSPSRNADTVADVREMLTQGRRCAARMITD
jgi:hypothetical protein